jgi:hypothetical protein
VRARDAEHSHHGIADELLHRGAVPLEYRAELSVVSPHPRPQCLWVELVAESREPAEVAEEDAHRLANIPPRLGRLERRSAMPAEAEAVRALLRATTTGGHRASV